MLLRLRTFTSGNKTKASIRIIRTEAFFLLGYLFYEEAGL